MKLLLLSLTCCILGGCGTYGEPLLLARWYDSRDPCQKQNYGTAPQPSFCGATSGRTYIYPKNGPAVGYTGK